MARDEIRMTPETMRARANEYTTQAGNIQQVINKMDSLLKLLQEEWEGEASRAYFEQYNQMRPGFVKAKDLVDAISAELKKSAQIVEDTDRTLAGQYRA